jgi:soluble lytic murein transglycosylase-like protein
MAARRLLNRLSRWAGRVRWRVWAWRARWALIVVAPLVLLNLLVALCGHSAVFPLSPRFLRPKAIALGRYVLHRAHCLGTGHPPLAPLLQHAETKHRLPRGLLAAVVEVESNGRVHRISPAGAMGPAQLTDGTARALGVDDPFDSAQNLEGAARYLAMQFAHFHDVRLAAAAYNAGPGSIVARAVPRNGETEIYVERVMRAYRRIHPPERLVVRRKAEPDRGEGATKRAKSKTRHTSP